MDLWSRWLDQPVESSPQDVDPGASSLVGAVQHRDQDGSTTVAAVCSYDGDDDTGQRLSEDLGREEEEEPEKNHATELPVPTDFTAGSPTSSILPPMALEDLPRNFHSPRRMTLVRRAQDDDSPGTKRTPPEEPDGTQQKENAGLHPTLPNSQESPDALNARLHQVSDQVPFRFRPTSMSRPNRPSPLSSSSRSSQHISSGSIPKFSPMATPSNRISRQYATRPFSYLSPTKSQHTCHNEGSTSWKVWEDRLESDGSQLSSTHPEKMADEEPRPDLMYPCPFRRRNPARFNVRDHTHCAKTLFSSTQDLRLHITSYHRRQRVLHQCRRCKLGFESETALDQHMMLPKDQICESISEESFIDPEDGITDATDRQLVVGHPSAETWEEIWRAVFPGDLEVPAPDFHPIVELVEVEQQFNEGQETLKTTLQETLRLFLPPDVHSDFCRFLSGQLELAFETHRANTMRNCLNRLGSPGTNAYFQPPPTAHSADHAVMTRGQKRTSKRTSLLYSASVPNTPRFPSHTVESPEQIPSLPLHSLANTTTTQLQRSNSTRSANRASRLFLSLPPSHAVRSATPFPQTPVTAALSVTSGDNQSDYDCSRESRDSGLGFPCEVCDMDSCQCKEIARALSSSKHSALIRPMAPEPKASISLETSAIEAMPRPSRGYPQGQRRTLRHFRPGLRIRTGTPGFDGNTDAALVSSITANSSSNKSSPSPFLVNFENQDQQRPFSPQSFKQRVMRKVSGET